MIFAIIHRDVFRLPEMQRLSQQWTRTDCLLFLYIYQVAGWRTPWGAEMFQRADDPHFGMSLLTLFPSNRG